MVGAFVEVLIGDKVEAYVAAGKSVLLISEPITWFNKILLRTVASTVSTVTPEPSD